METINNKNTEQEKLKNDIPTSKIKKLLFENFSEELILLKKLFGEKNICDRLIEFAPDFSPSD